MEPNSQSPPNNQTGAPSSAPDSQNQITDQTPDPTKSNTTFPSVFSLYKPSWQALKLSFITSVKLGLVAILPLFALILVPILQLAAPNSGSGKIVIDITSIIIGIAVIVSIIWLSVIIAPGIVYTQLQATRGVKVDFKEAFEYGKPLAFNFFILDLFVGLIVLGGFILFIVPGIFMLKRYILVNYYFVDKKLSYKEAMSVAKESSKKYSGVHWGILGIQFLTQAVSYIPLIGPFISLAMSVMYYLVPVVRYEQIRQAK